MRLDGLPVRDATEPLSFDVTRRDISRGGLKEPDSCAMALACKREHKVKDVRIHIKYSYVLEAGHWVRYRTPACVAREIVAFDRGGAFEPGEYMLLVPHKSTRIGVRKPGPKHYNKRRPIKYIHITANVRSSPVFATRVTD